MNAGILALFVLTAIFQAKVIHKMVIHMRDLLSRRFIKLFYIFSALSIISAIGLSIALAIEFP